MLRSVKIWIVSSLIAGIATAGALALTRGVRSHSPGHTSSPASSTPGPELQSAEALPRKAHGTEFYRTTISARLFMPPGPTPVPAPPTLQPAPTLPVSGAPAAPPPVVPERSLLADYTYSGTVRFGNGVAALLEHLQSREGHYVEIGDTFLSGVVVRITDDEIAVRRAGKEYILAKSDRFNTTPLMGAPTGPAMGVPTKAGGERNSAASGSNVPPATSKAIDRMGKTHMKMDVPPMVNDQLRNLIDTSLSEMNSVLSEIGAGSSGVVPQIRGILGSFIAEEAENSD